MPLVAVGAGGEDLDSVHVPTSGSNSGSGGEGTFGNIGAVDVEMLGNDPVLGESSTSLDVVTSAAISPILEVASADDTGPVDTETMHALAEPKNIISPALEVFLDAVTPVAADAEAEEERDLSEVRIPVLSASSVPSDTQLDDKLHGPMDTYLSALQIVPTIIVPVMEDSVTEDPLEFEGHISLVALNEGTQLPSEGSPTIFTPAPLEEFPGHVEVVEASNIQAGGRSFGEGVVAGVLMTLLFIYGSGNLE